MGTGDSRDRDARPRTVLDRVAVVLALVLALVHIALGVTAGTATLPSAEQFLVVGVVFLAGIGLYFTSYWRPVLYALAALFVLFLGVLWVATGMRYLPVGLATGVVGATFVVVALYLFVRDHRRAAGS